MPGREPSLLPTVQCHDRPGMKSRDPLALKSGGIGDAKPVWHATREFATGIEYMWGARRATNGEPGGARRVQGMVRPDF
jgi:hypothetical protein